MDERHGRAEDAVPRARQQTQGGVAPAARVKPGMTVIDEDGAALGVVEAIEGDEIRLAKQPGDGDHRLLPLSLVAAVDRAAVTMRGRGDNAFGIAAEG